MYEVSVIMSTYNEKKEELEKAINSILMQTFKNFEFIIILDNPNNVEHIKIINNFLYKDDRIKFFINKENIGLARSLNKGIEIANCKYIARMDADDISLPERLEKEYRILEKDKSIDIVSTNKICINENDIEIEKSNDLPENDKQIKQILKYMSIIVHPTVMFRKDKIDKIGKYRNFSAAQDYDLWLRAVSSNLKFHIINEYLIKYRIRDNNVSNTNPLKQWIIHEYIYKLYKQRAKQGTDSFSIENVDRYLKKNKVYEIKSIEKFKKGMKNIEKCKKNLKEKNILISIHYLLRALFSHKKIKNIIFNYSLSYYYKRKGKNI